MHHLVGTAEIAELLGVSRQRVAQLSQESDDFPKPEAELGAGRIWKRGDIDAWVARNRPKPPRDQYLGLRSTRGARSHPTTVVFVNELPYVVEISWIDQSGKTVPYKTLAPGEAHTQSTFVGHPWQVSNEDGDVHGVYFPDPQPRTIALT